MTNDKQARETPKVKQRWWDTPYGASALLALLGIACYALFQVAIYFFAVPQACTCQAKTIPPAMSAASVFENSINDSNSITIGIGNSETEGLTICYSDKPARGVTDQLLSWSAGCEYEVNYIIVTGRHYSTDVEAATAFEISTPVVSFPSGAKAKRRSMRQDGALVMNRGDNTCRFSLSEWKEGFLSGELNCVDPVFLFNPWSWRQAAQLFYSRAFFAIHARKKKD